MFKLPIEFSSQASASGDFEKVWSTSSSVHVLDNSIPPEFGGAGGGFSPEDLFLQAVMNCFVGTFKVVAKGSRVNFSKLSVAGRLIVDKGDDGKPCMKTISLQIKIFDADRPDRIATLVSKVFRDGFIINSVKTGISYELEQLNSSPGLQV